MHVEPLQALQAANRAVPPPSRTTAADVLLAGAGGALGQAVLHELLARGRGGTVQVLAREPLKAGLRGIASHIVASDDPAQWTSAEPAQATGAVGIVLFEPPRSFHDRERAFWTPEPAQLPALAAWLRASGVTTLALVLPHEQGRLPQALRQGLSNLDEHSVAAMGFERLLILRSAQRPADGPSLAALPGLARWMLSITRFMVPTSEQPVRPAKVAELLAVALELAPPGIHVAAPEVVWRSAQGPLRQVAQAWLLA